MYFSNLIGLLSRVEINHLICLECIDNVLFPNNYGCKKALNYNPANINDLRG